MTSEQKRALIKAYEEWEPGGGESAEDVANAHGVTRSAMFALLRREGIPLKTGRTATRLNGQGPLRHDLNQVLIDSLNEANIEVGRLREENRRLRDQVLQLMTVGREDSGTL